MTTRELITKESTRKIKKPREDERDLGGYMRMFAGLSKENLQNVEDSLHNFLKLAAKKNACGTLPQSMRSKTAP